MQAWRMSSCQFIKIGENMSLKRVKLSEQKKAWKSSLGKITREPGSIKPQNKRSSWGGWGGGGGGVKEVRGEKKTV